MPVTHGVEVALPHPVGCLLGMATTGPGPQRLEDSVVHSRKGTRTGHMAMERGPTPNHGVELLDQLACRGLPTLPDGRSHLVQERMYVLGRRSDAHPAAIGLQVLSQEVHAIVDVGDDGFLR